MTDKKVEIQKNIILIEKLDEDKNKNAILLLKTNIEIIKKNIR